MRRFLAVMLLAAAVSCGGDKTTGPTAATITGTWTLQSVNGSALPYTVAQTGANKVEVTADVLTIASSSFTQTTTVRSTINGQVTTQSVSDAGTYTLNGTAASFRFNSDGSTGTGSFSGSTLTVAEDGFAYVYTKQ